MSEMIDFVPDNKKYRNCNGLNLILGGKLSRVP